MIFEKEPVSTLPVQTDNIRTDVIRLGQNLFRFRQSSSPSTVLSSLPSSSPSPSPSAPPRSDAAMSPKALSVSVSSSDTQKILTRSQVQRHLPHLCTMCGSRPFQATSCVTVTSPKSSSIESGVLRGASPLPLPLCTSIVAHLCDWCSFCDHKTLDVIASLESRIPIQDRANVLLHSERLKFIRTWAPCTNVIEKIIDMAKNTLEDLKNVDHERLVDESSPYGTMDKLRAYYKMTPPILFDQGLTLLKIFLEIYRTYTKTPTAALPNEFSTNIAYRILDPWRKGALPPQTPSQSGIIIVQGPYFRNLDQDNGRSFMAHCEIRQAELTGLWKDKVALAKIMVYEIENAQAETSLFLKSHRSITPIVKDWTVGGAKPPTFPVATKSPTALMTNSSPFSNERMDTTSDSPQSITRTISMIIKPKSMRPWASAPCP